MGWGTVPPRQPRRPTGLASPEPWARAQVSLEVRNRNRLSCVMLLGRAPSACFLGAGLASQVHAVAPKTRGSSRTIETGRGLFAGGTGDGSGEVG